MKIAQCGANGELEFDPTVYSDLDEQTSRSIEATPEGERAALAQLLDVADAEKEVGASAEAVNSYLKVLDRCVEGNRVRPGFDEIARKAYYGLVSMAHSDDEFAWESAAVAADGYAKILGL